MGLGGCCDGARSELESMINLSVNRGIKKILNEHPYQNALKCVALGSIEGRIARWARNQKENLNENREGNLK